MFETCVIGTENPCCVCKGDVTHIRTCGCIRMHVLGPLLGVVTSAMAVPIIIVPEWLAEFLRPLTSMDLTEKRLFGP